MLTLMPRAGVGAAWKVAAVEAGSTVAVFGLGTVGLAVMSNDTKPCYYCDIHYLFLSF
jgi:Zn-dependent alcohol dehydrogenase